MPGITNIVLFALAGAFGGSAAWAFVLALSTWSAGGLLTEMALGSIAGMFIGAFLGSREPIAGRQFAAAARRAAFGGAAGLIGGAAGAGLGSTVFTTLGALVVDAGGFPASLGVALAAALGWAILGASVGLCGGMMVRSRERALYGLSGGVLGGLFGGLMLSGLSATSIWSALAGLCLLGMSIGAFISLVEETFVTAKVKVVKGRHLNREFPLFKDLNVVGRDDRSDVCLSGAEGVGIQHAVIRRTKGRYSIETDDEGKMVYVNQKPTRSSGLADGDVIRVGSILLMFSAMRKAAALVVFVLLAGLSGMGESAAQAGEPASVRISQFDLTGFPVVKAYVSILDSANKPVRGLTSAGVTLSENGRPVPIDTMRMKGMDSGPEPVSLAIVLDRSGSMAGDKIVKAKESVLRFLALMEPGDRASLITFSDNVDKVEPPTENRELLKQRTEAILADGHTALFDAIAAGVESVKGVPGRRTVVVLTDGIANRGALDINQAVAAAIKEYVSVYVVGLGKDVRAARLEGIAEMTGGFYFYAPSADGLAEIYESISKRIHNEYIVTYRTEKRADYLRNATLTLSPGLQTTRAYFQPESSLFGAGGNAPGWAFGVSLASVLAFALVSLRKVERKYETGHLSLVRGQGTRKDVDINATVTIGRDGRNGLGLIRDSAVAEQHAEVVKENGKYFIEDKGTASGTFVNKTRVVGKQALADGDVIDVGHHTTIVFSEESPWTCAGCGNPVRSGAKFCVKCGKRAA
jgi:VWFA-related protein